MLTKMRNPENQDFLSCHTAAVLAERRGSGGGSSGYFASKDRHFAIGGALWLVLYHDSYLSFSIIILLLLL
jgi:hypothetical protein